MTRAGRRPNAIRDVFFRPRKSAVQRLPTNVRIRGLRDLVGSDGLIPIQSHDKIQRIGRRLFRLVVQNPKVFRDQVQGHGRLRVWLVLDQPHNVQPWELLCDPTGGPENYLAYSRRTPIVRTLRRPSARRRVKGIDGPLKVLGVIASPLGSDVLNTGKEKRALARALAEPIDQGLVELAWLEGPDTVRKLRTELRRSWHVVHFIGHGGIDERRQIGVLAFEDRNGRPNPVDAGVFGQMFVDSAVRMVVLNSCRGASAGDGGLLSSTAARIAQYVPAVVAMQISISDKAAVEFASEFYRGLFGGLTIDLAVTEARMWLATGNGEPSAIEWPAPVVYLSSLRDVLGLTTLKARRERGRGTLRSKAKTLAVREKDIATHVPAPAAPPDDPQKHQWGGVSVANGRVLSGVVKSLGKEWYEIRLKVRARSGAPPLETPVTFHLHNSFAEPRRAVNPRNGTASLRLVAYGAFTVGVEADRGKTRLELDLAEIGDAPAAFRRS